VPAEYPDGENYAEQPHQRRRHQQDQPGPQRHQCRQEANELDLIAPALLGKEYQRPPGNVLTLPARKGKVSRHPVGELRHFHPRFVERPGLGIAPLGEQVHRQRATRGWRAGRLLHCLTQCALIVRQQSSLGKLRPRFEGRNLNHCSQRAHFYRQTGSGTSLNSNQVCQTTVPLMFVMVRLPVV